MATLVLLGGLVAGLCQVGHASPANLTQSVGTVTGNVSASTVTVTADFTTITPIVIDHGHLDEAGIASLLRSLNSSQSQPTSVPNVKREAPIVTTSSQGPFLIGDAVSQLQGKCAPSKLTNVTVAGPIKKLTVFSDENYINKLQITSTNGSTTERRMTIPSTDSQEHTFVFELKERVTEFTLYHSDRDFAGFSFKTNLGHSFDLLIPVYRDLAKAVQVPVGSGILARIRLGICSQHDFFAALGFDFLEEVESVSIIHMEYAGFKDGKRPLDEGEVIASKSAQLYNEVSIEQKMDLKFDQTTTNQHSITSTSEWNIGLTGTISGKAGIPFLADGSISVGGNWGLKRSTADLSLTSTAVTSSDTMKVGCPAYKFCTGKGTFTKYTLDTDAVATIEAKTKSGATYEWLHNVHYHGHDSTSMIVHVHQADLPEKIPS